MIPGLEDILEKGMATHSSILAWRIPRAEEPGGLQSMRLQRVKHVERLTQLGIWRNRADEPIFRAGIDMQMGRRDTWTQGWK